MIQALTLIKREVVSSRNFGSGVIYLSYYFGSFVFKLNPNP